MATIASGLVETSLVTPTVVFAGLLWVLVFERIGMYRRSFSLTARDEVYASLAASALSVAPAFAIFLFDPVLRPYRLQSASRAMRRTRPGAF